MNVLEYAALQYEHDDTLAHLWHVERDGVHFLLYFKGGGSLSYDAKAAGTEAEISRAFDQEIVRFESGTYHNEVWEVVSETMDEDSGRYLKIFDHPTFGIDWEKVSGSISDEDQFCDMLEKQINTWKGASHSMPVGSHPYWPKFHEMVKAAVREKYGNSIRLYRGIHGDQAPDILAGVPVKMFRFSSWTSDLSSARVYAAGKTKRGGRDWVVVRRNFSPEEIAFAPVTLSGPCENPDILMRLMQDVEHYGDEFIVSLSQLVPGDYKIAAQPKGTRESFLRKYIRELLAEDLASRQEFVKDIQANPQYQERTVSQGDKEAASKMFQSGRELKKAFHKHADKAFMDSLITIHWAQDEYDIIKLLKASSKDELSTNAYLPNELATGEYGNYGLQVKGHISLLANNMDDVVTGMQYAYRSQIGTHRTKSSGMNKGVAKSYYPPEYGRDDWAPIVLSKEDWNPAGAGVGVYGNEALVDNWKPVAFVVADDRPVPVRFRTYAEDRGLEIIQTGRGDG